jgi:PAS domain S-box-containing protein
MKNQRKAKKQAPDELAELRQRVALLEAEVNGHKRAEETLREYQKVLEAAQDMFAVIDRHYRYLLVNAKFLAYRGLNREQVVGRSVAEVLGKDVFEREVKKRLDACFRGKAVQYEMKYTYPGLGERKVLESCYPIESPDGISRVVSAIRDITDTKRTEEALMASESEAKRLAQENASIARIGQTWRCWGLLRRR